MNQPLPPAPRPPQREHFGLSDDWLQWIAEQRLRGCTPESMLATMTGAGLDAQLCNQCIRDAEQHPFFRAAQRMQQLPRKLESVMGNLQLLWESGPDHARVEKRANVSADELMTRYVHGCRPLVLTDVARDWPAMKRWSPLDLKTRFGHIDVEVQSERSVDSRYEMNKLAHRRHVNLGVFVDQVVSGGSSNDYYMTANNEAMRKPEFAPLLDDIGALPEICDRDQLATCSSFWFGPAGTVTPLHHDTLMLFHTQVVGRKRWRFISPLYSHRVYNHFQVYSPIDLDAPDLQRYPEFSGVRVLETVVEPGETVFLPLCWWHQVRALDISLSFSYSNLAIHNHYTYANPDIANW